VPFATESVAGVYEVPGQAVLEDQAADEVPAVCGRDRHRHRHTFTVKVSQQVGLPGEISIAALAETTDRDVPVNAHAPQLVDASSASERFAANGAVTPLLECLPSHRPHLRGGS